MALGIVEKDFGGVTVLELSGQITVGEDSRRLRSKTKAVLDSGRTDLVMDFARVGYIDSTGLGTILAVFTTARNLGANIKLASLAKKFRDQLHQTGLERVFEIYEQVEGAVSSYHGTS
jgi:anti-sigma B factor antagonist